MQPVFSVTSKQPHFRSQKGHKMDTTEQGFDDDERIEMSQLLVQEIKTISRLSWENISNQLNACGTVSINIPTDLLRQYKSGKPAGKKRLFLIARAALKCGWAGPVVMEIMDYASQEEALRGNMSETEFREWAQDLSNLHKADRRAMQNATTNLEKALRSLMVWGWQQQEVAYMALALIEELTPLHNGSGRGGLVDPATLPYFRQEDEEMAPLWVQWDISNWLERGLNANKNDACSDTGNSDN